MAVEKLKGIEDAQDLAKKEQEIDNALVAFGENAENDSKFLESTSGKDVVKSVSDDLSRKSEELNDPKAKAKVAELSNNIKQFSNIERLTPEQAKEISQVYKMINSIEATEHAEDAQAGEQAQKSKELETQQESQKLIEACDRLQDLLKTHHEEAQQRVENNIKKSQEARNQPKETPPDPIDNWPGEGTKEG